ncbi:MAG TPA: hypothetical protein VGO47_07705, partial [Chlamydiales bacterium]|nr:hypothetical protein [Chlamydiales bacterium]
PPGVTTFAAKSPSLPTSSETRSLKDLNRWLREFNEQVTSSRGSQSSQSKQPASKTLEKAPSSIGSQTFSQFGALPEVSFNTLDPSAGSLADFVQGSAPSSASKEPLVVKPCSSDEGEVSSQHSVSGCPTLLGKVPSDDEALEVTPPSQQALLTSGSSSQAINNESPKGVPGANQRAPSPFKPRLTVDLTILPVVPISAPVPSSPVPSRPKDSDAEKFRMCQLGAEWSELGR